MHQMPVGYLLTSSKVWSRLKTGDNDILFTFVLDTFISKLEDFHQHIDHHFYTHNDRRISGLLLPVTTGGTRIQ